MNYELVILELLTVKTLKIMIELWFEAPERRMGNKQGIDGFQYLSISNLSISESQITESQLPSIFKAFMHQKRHKSIIF